MRVILGMGGHGKQSDEGGCRSEQHCWQPSLGREAGENTDPPAAAGAGGGAMSLAGLMAPGRAPSVRVQGREEGWQCQAAAVRPPPAPLPRLSCPNSPSEG